MYLDGEKPNPETPATETTATASSSSAPAADPVPVPVVAPASTTTAAPVPEAPAAVVYPDHHHDVAQIDALEPRVVAIVGNVIGDKFMVEIEAAVARELDARIDNLKADILAHLTPMIQAITAAPAAAAPVPSSAAPHVLAAGDPVRVYKDADHKTFYTGEIVTVHEGGHAADVKIAELEGAVTTVRIESLEYDDRR